MVTSWRRWILGALAVVSVAVLLASCTGFFGTDIGGWDPPPPSGVLPAPNPVNVTPELDAGRATTVTLGPAGGTASVAGADGTVFTLRVPAKALFQETDITLTPLTDIPDLPTGGGFVAGVDLQPDGLRFAAPAELDMELGAGLDASDLTPAVITGPNHEFGLVPAAVAGRTVTFSLAHFSDPTTGKGATTGNPVPSGVEGRAKSAIAQNLSQGITLTSAYAQILEQWYDRQVKVAIDGISSDTQVVEAELGYADWISNIEVLGRNHDVKGLPAALHGRILDGATRFRGRVGHIIATAVASCRAGAGPQAGWDVTYLPVLVTTMWPIENLFPGILPEPDVTPWVDAISSCLHFVMYYTHLISVGDGTNFYFQAVATATPEFDVVFRDGDWQVQIDDVGDEIASLVSTVNECRLSSWSSVPSTFHVVSVHALRKNTRTPGVGAELDPNMTLTFDPGDPRVTGTVRCADGSSGPLPPATDDLWRLAFASLRATAGDPPTQATLTHWTMPYGAYVAHAHLGQSSPDLGKTITEDGDVDIEHQPL